MQNACVIFTDTKKRREDTSATSTIHSGRSLSAAGPSLISGSIIHQSLIGTMMTKRSRLDEAGACGTVAVATEGFPLGTTATSSEHVSRSKALSASATATLHTGSTSASSSSSSLTSMSQQPATGGETVVNPELIALAPVAAVGSTSAEPQVAATPQRSPRGPRLPQKIGRWSLDEKILFLYGLKMYGKGRWKRMSKFLPDR